MPSVVPSLTMNRDAFKSNHLVYISAPKPAKWVKLDTCRWEAPASIVTLHALNQRFKQNQELFVHKLRIGNVTAADVVEELKKFNGRLDAIETIRELLSLLNSYVEEGVLDTRNLQGLVDKSVKILPVAMGDSRELRSFFDMDWFIADDDMPLLVQTFQDVVWYLDCKELTQRRPRVLLEKLGRLDRLLSETRTEKAQAEHLSAWDPKASKALRAKGEFLSR